MVVWDVPDEAVGAIGRRMSELPFVTLCYRRERRPPTWPYNLFCMIHGRDRQTVLGQIAELRAVARSRRRAVRRAVQPATLQAAGRPLPRHPRDGDGVMDDIDRRIINGLQGGFPIVERPFADARGAVRPRRGRSDRPHRATVRRRLAQPFRPDVRRRPARRRHLSCGDGGAGRALRGGRVASQRASRGRAQLCARARAEHVVRRRRGDVRTGSIWCWTRSRRKPGSPFTPCRSSKSTSSARGSMHEPGRADLAHRRPRSPHHQGDASGPAAL